MKKLIKMFVLFLMSGLFLSACGKAESVQTQNGYEDGKYYIYYVNKEETKVVGEEYVLRTKTTEGMIQELLSAMEEEPENLQLKKSLGSDIKVVSHSLESNQLSLDMEVSYLQLNKTAEILNRAAIVRTMTQIPEVESVIFSIGGEPMLDAAGNTMGIMTADTFIDNTGKEINAYEKTTLKLYFANLEGTALVEKDEEVIYSSNISMEKLIVEKLIEGPQTDDVRATLSPNRKINSITVKDGICYVNLSGVTIDNLGAVAEDVSIYSIVNSLSELKNVNKVQISVDGETDRMFRESISLKTVFERNLDLMDTGEEPK